MSKASMFLLLLLGCCLAAVQAISEGKPQLSSFGAFVAGHEGGKLSSLGRTVNNFAGDDIAEFLKDQVVDKLKEKKDEFLGVEQRKKAAAKLKFDQMIKAHDDKVKAAKQKAWMQKAKADADQIFRDLKNKNKYASNNVNTNTKYNYKH